MTNETDPETKTLLEKGFISNEQFAQVSEYRARNIFSLFVELRGLLYVAVSLFAAGAGIIIYKNIDTIGHTVILAGILLTCIICFYFSFKNSKGFTREAVVIDSHVHDYLVLAANLLAGVFIGYLQYQYHPFGAYNNLAALLPTLVYFFSAYYFDHKGVLSMAVTGLAAFIGLSVTPRIIFGFDEVSYTTLGFSAVFLGSALIAASIFAERENFKKHFNTTYQNFGLHFIGIACVSNLYSTAWPVYVLVLAITVYYFIWMAYRVSSLNFLFFAAVYGYIGLNILLVRLLSRGDLFMALAYLSPFYFIVSVILFIKWLMNFKKRTKNAGL